MLKQTYSVKMTPKLGIGERATLVLSGSRQKYFFNLNDKEPQEIELDPVTAAQLKSDGYEVVAKSAPAGKPGKKSEE
jgi:hypothetical protein